MSTAVALPPITYVPKKHKNMFIDNISDFSATVFKNTGVFCPCSGKTYHNKYTFEYQHTKTNKHCEWLSNYHKTKTLQICRKCESQNEEIKKLKVMVGTVDQENFILKQKIERLERELQELRENAEQYNEFIVEEKRKTMVYESAFQQFVASIENENIRINPCHVLTE
jgi:DNA repair exonuclease SbcCD ATPase subunit